MRRELGAPRAHCIAWCARTGGELASGMVGTVSIAQGTFAVTPHFFVAWGSALLIARREDLLFLRRLL